MQKNIEKIASKIKSWWNNLDMPNTPPELTDYGNQEEEQEEIIVDKFNPIAYVTFDINAEGSVRLVFDTYAISDLHSTNLAALMYSINNGMLEDVMLTKAVEVMKIPEISKFIEDVLQKYKALIEANENMSVINPEDTFSIGKTGKRNNNESIS